MPVTAEKKMHKLFTVTKKDLVIQTFRAGGPGGQNQNKRNTGVRIIHPASGAIGESREERSQHQNKKVAFLRMAKSEKFNTWVRIEAGRINGTQIDVEKRVEQLMKPENLQIETRDSSGKWITCP